MGSQSSKLVSESQQKKEHIVQLSGQSSKNYFTITSNTRQFLETITFQNYHYMFQGLREWQFASSKERTIRQQNFKQIQNSSNFFSSHFIVNLYNSFCNYLMQMKKYEKVILYLNHIIYLNQDQISIKQIIKIIRYYMGEYIDKYLNCALAKLILSIFLYKLSGQHSLQMELWWKQSICDRNILQLDQSHPTLKIRPRIQYLCVLIILQQIKNYYKKRLPPGIHQYKFIVDGEWRFSPEDSQTTDDNGNINNIIDTTNYKNHQNVLQETQGRPVAPFEQRDRDRKGTTFEDIDFDKLTVGGTPSSHRNNNVNNNKPVQKNPFELQSEKYGFSSTGTRAQALPEFSFKDKAPICPPHLNEIYFLKQKEQKHTNVWRSSKIDENMTPEEIENKKREEKNEIMAHLLESDHSLAPPQHVTTKHVGIKAIKSQTYNVYSITQRYKQKYTTFKFYTNQYVEGSTKLFIA